MKNKIFITLALLIVCMLVTNGLDAQCPMCRMSAESNLKNGGTEGKALNTGILYLLALPYLAIMIVGFLWYKNKRKIDQAATGVS